MAPFWSLAVEEQFYLFWPWVILLVPRRWLLATILSVIVLGPVYRLLALAVGINGIARQVLLFGCLDSLGMGGLLAYATFQDAGSGVRVRRLARAGLAVGAAIWLGLLFLPDTPARAWLLPASDLTWAWPAFSPGWWRGLPGDSEGWQAPC